MSLQITMQCPRVSDFDRASQNFAITALLISLVGIVDAVAKKLIPLQGIAAKVIHGPFALGLRVNEALALVAGLSLSSAVDYLTNVREIDSDLEIQAGIIVGLFLSYRLLVNCYSQFSAFAGGSMIGGFVAAGLLAAKNVVLYRS